MPDSPADYETILYERRGRVGLITLNRPEKLNAWNPRMEDEFIDVVGRASTDRAVGALVVTGAGRAFCAGGDISGWSAEISSRGERRPESPLLNREGSPEVPIVLRRGKPIIAAINGPAIGIGLTMPLACDIRIASDKATFSASFVKVGLTPDCGRTRHLPAVAGLGHALFLALTGAIVDENDAEGRGWVVRVGGTEMQVEESLSAAAALEALHGDAVWAAKRLLHESAAEGDLRRVVTQEGFAIREMRRSPDHAEAVQAFMEKREPRFND